MGMKASAFAHPVQELIRYRGVADENLRFPFHDSISVCISPPRTLSTIEFGDFDEDHAIIDGNEAWGDRMERIVNLVDELRLRARSASRFRVMASNDSDGFPHFDAGSSGFGSIVVAACKALDLDIDLHEVASIAARGSVSSPATLLGGYSRFKGGLGSGESRTHKIASEDLQMGVLVPSLKETISSADMREKSVRSPPIFSGLAVVTKLAEEMEMAIREGNVGRMLILAEEDTLLFHGVTPTGVGELSVWPPETLKMVYAVRKARDEGLPAFFSVERNGGVFINTLPDKVDEIAERMDELGIGTLKCHIGRKAELSENHLF
jgi:phosphomevalonate decarboxylase